MSAAPDCEVARGDDVRTINAYRNARHTARACNGTGKRRANNDEAARLAALLTLAGLPVPTDADCDTHGAFNGTGAV